MYKVLVHIVFILVSISAFAQKERASIRSGNKQYEQKNYTKAETDYLNALSKNKNSIEAQFNLGDALYKLKKYPEAIQQFDQLSKQTTDKDLLSKINHNLGNSYLEAKKYEESVKAYKEALKNNSKDEDSRYNLAYAQKMLQQQKNKENKDNKDNKDKNKDKKEDDKNKGNEEGDKNKDKDNKDEKENKDKKEDDKNKENKEQQKPKENKDQMKKEEAERILDALNKKEKELKNKRKQKGSAVDVQIEKDW